MNYPDDFNIPTFAAGKSIAVSRAMGIGIMSGFLIIIFLCGLLIWTVRSMRVEPYILATGGINDEWRVISPGNNRPNATMSSNQVIQESLVWKFVQDWFSVSKDNNINEEIWGTSCNRDDCIMADTGNKCKIFCATDDAMFRRFKDDILPTYKSISDSGEYWTPIVDSIRISPVGYVSDAGGTWRIEMSIARNNNTTFGILAYAKIAKSGKFHPSTMGYYIRDFNAYRIN